MVSITQISVPLATLEGVDDSGFTPGNPNQWVDAYLVQVRNARNAGLWLRGRVLVAIDVAERMVGYPINIDASSSPMQIFQGNEDYDGIDVLADISMPANSARYE